MFAAVLDTNVLWPSLQRDFLLSMAIEGLYRPLWSEAILDELQRTEHDKWVWRGLEQEEASIRADHLLTRMRRAFDDALVTGWEPLEGSFKLPDFGDEHVVAAAVVGGAGAIVTRNIKHFPADRVPTQIQILTAPEFAANTADVDPERAARALRVLAARHRDPRHTPAQILDLLVQRYGMNDVAEIVTPSLSEDMADEPARRAPS